MNALNPLGMVSELPSENQSPSGCIEVQKDYFVEKDGVKFAGTHLLVDLWGASNLCDPDLIDAALREAAEGGRCDDSAQPFPPFFAERRRVRRAGAG